MVPRTGVWLPTSAGNGMSASPSRHDGRAHPRCCKHACDTLECRAGPHLLMRAALHHASDARRREASSASRGLAARLGARSRLEGLRVRLLQRGRHLESRMGACVWFGRPAMRRNRTRDRPYEDWRGETTTARTQTPSLSVCVGGGGGLLSREIALHATMRRLECVGSAGVGDCRSSGSFSTHGSFTHAGRGR